MKTNAIVSLADEKYFDLLIELIDSIKKKTESKDTAICVLDAGMNDSQREHVLFDYHSFLHRVHKLLYLCSQFSF